MRAVVAGFRFQWWRMLRNADELQAFLISPLFALIFGALVLSRNRPDLLPSAALGAALLGMWTLCLQAGGNVIESERRGGTFEALESTPAALRNIVIGRVAVISMLTLLTLPEVWLFVLTVFHRTITVGHPVLLAVTLLLIAIGLHATSVLFSALFVLAREPVIFQNALAYPIYLLGGLVIPVAYLPDAVQPISRLLFLSWGSDLARDALAAAAVDDLPVRLMSLGATVLATIVLSQLVFTILLRRARRVGTLNLV
ncbi:ABC transporter permease [Krasilnikovia sp. M28-CT-15]|uniref:ABC transporter permease n=1 Tax=Krasilnikovia sp. M28-CT-15 TaxID=3373540 RepID=UPI00387620F7